MNGPESKQWDTLKRKTSHQILWARHEDELSPDIPDLSFTTPYGAGWVELKTMAYWPRKHSTTINLPHLRPGQVNWAMKRWIMGANCWMLLQVIETDEWLLIDPYLMQDILHRKVSRVLMMERCRAYWCGAPTTEKLIEALCTRLGEKMYLLREKI